MVNRWISERPSRSSFHTTTVAPGNTTSRNDKQPMLEGVAAPSAGSGPSQPQQPTRRQARVTHVDWVSCLCHMIGAYA